jgi:pentose-5-phosphate-3-epimerase
MVEAIRRSCDDFSDSTDAALLDVHMCVDRPARFVAPMAAAGADLFIFQWEAMEESVAKAKRLGMQIVEAGMKCGISKREQTKWWDR